jgi:MoaA/NifB/PqqE/SkfB family radical SAM enzyme
MDILAKKEKYLLMHFSLDSHLSKKHDYLRGVTGTFDKVIKNIKYWRFIKKQKFSITSVISEVNRKELTDLCDFAIDLNAYSINFQPINLYSFINKKKSLKEFRTHEMWPKNYKDLKIDLLKLIEYKKSKKGYIVNNSLEELESFLVYFKNPFDKNQKCTSNNRNIAIHINGDVSLCFNGPFIIGNILSDDIGSMFDSKKRRDLSLKKDFCAMPCKVIACYRNKNFKYKIYTLGSKISRNLAILSK